MNVLVIGYYGYHNLGDELYKAALPKIIYTARLHFVSLSKVKTIDVSKYNAVILGGGDVLIPWFTKKIPNFNGPVYLLGGIPYEEHIYDGSLERFDYVFTRTKSRLRILAKVISPRYAHFMPDPVFCLNTPISRGQSKKLGVFIVGSMCTKGGFGYSLVRFLSTIRDNFNVTVYAFDTSSPNNVTSDLSVAHRLARATGSRLLISECHNEIFEEIATLEVAVCMRFHSHVLCAMAGVPFISLGNTPKVIDLNEQMRWEYTFTEPPETFEEYVPMLDTILSRRNSLSEKLLDMSMRYKRVLEHHKINTILAGGERRQLPLNPYLTIDVEGLVMHFKEELMRVARVKNLAEAKLDFETARELSRSVCYSVTKNPDCIYIYGTTINLMNVPEKIESIIKWIIRDQIQSHSQMSSVDMWFSPQPTLEGFHRAGWKYVTQRLQALMSEHPDTLLDTFIDRSFLWSKPNLLKTGVLPYTSRWIGIAHHTPNEEFTKNNAKNIVESPEFVKSLETCVGLVCMSERLSDFYRRYVSVPVITTCHPTLFVDQVFDFNSFTKNRRLVNVGAWYRNPWSIYTLRAPNGWSKYALKGKKMEKYFPPESTKFSLKDVFDPNLRKDNMWEYFMLKWIRERISSDSDPDMIVDLDGNDTTPLLIALKRNLCRMRNTVQTIEKLSDSEYDDLLSTSVVFLHLIDASAANTIIECIVRNTPILINKIAPVVEYLGENYPMYYEDLQQAPRLLTDDTIRRTTMYLQNLDKKFLTMDKFLHDITILLNQK